MARTTPERHLQMQIAIAQQVVLDALQEVADYMGGKDTQEYIEFVASLSDHPTIV